MILVTGGLGMIGAHPPSALPEGQHGFDTLDQDEASRAAMNHAMTWVVAALAL
jgi:nucleoside-diphosphate-sugar epimerase